MTPILTRADLSSRPTPDLIRGRAGTQFGVCAIEVMGPGTPTSRARDVSGRDDSGAEAAE